MKNPTRSQLIALRQHSLVGAANSTQAACLFRSRGNEHLAQFAERCAARNLAKAAKCDRALATSSR